MNTYHKLVEAEVRAHRTVNGTANNPRWAEVDVETGKGTVTVRVYARSRSRVAFFLNGRAVARKVLFPKLGIKETK